MGTDALPKLEGFSGQRSVYTRRFLRPPGPSDPLILGGRGGLGKEEEKQLGRQEGNRGGGV